MFFLGFLYFYVSYGFLKTIFKFILFFCFYVLILFIYLCFLFVLCVLALTCAVSCLVL